MDSRTKYHHHRRRRGCLRSYYYQYYIYCGRRPSRPVKLALVLAPALLVLLSILWWARSPEAAGRTAAPQPISFKARFRDMIREVERRLDGEIMSNAFRGEFSPRMCSEAKRQLIAPPPPLAAYAADRRSASTSNRPQAPWYAFRARPHTKKSQHLDVIEYSGLRIYPALSSVASQPYHSQMITVVAHLTVDRLERLSTFIHRLDASTTRVSAAIYVPNNFVDQGWSDVTAARHKIGLQLGCREENGKSECPNVDVHVVYGDTVDIAHASCKDGRLPPSRCLFYPIQELRNVALSMVRTAFVFSIDIDFIPSARGLFKRAMRMIQDHGSDGSGGGGGAEGLGGDTGPRNKKRVYVINLKDSRCGESGNFDDCKATDFLMPDHPAQSPSYTTKIAWAQSTAPQEVQYRLAYEPYFIGPTADLPRYDERFSYGNDKVQQVYDTAAAGFAFFVLPPSVGFLMHWEPDKNPAHLQSSRPLAHTRSPHSLLAMVARRAECVWPGSRDQFICDDNHVRRKWWWFWAFSSGFYKIAGCKSTEHRAWNQVFMTINEQRYVEQVSAARAAATRALPTVRDV